jgi:hypothetical protein
MISESTFAAAPHRSEQLPFELSPISIWSRGQIPAPLTLKLFATRGGTDEV